MSLQLSASLNLTGSINLSGSFTSTQTMTITSSISVNSLTASYINANNVYGTVTSSSYSLSSSFAPTNTNITASWSNNSLTASYVVNAQSASYYGGSVTSASYSLSSSFAPTNTNITASWSTNSLTASNLVTTNNYTVNNINSNGTGSFSIIGIGSSSPGAKLDIRQTSAATGLKVFTNDTSTAYIAQFIGYDNSLGETTRMVVQADGSVGIGTTSPSNTKLHILGDWVSGHSTAKIQTITSFASGGTSGIGLYDSDGTRSGYLYSYSTGTSVGSSNATPLIFETNGTEKMRVTSGGNVGIGTTSINAKLDILQSSTSNNQIRIYSDDGTAQLRTYSTSDGYGLIINQYYAVAGSPYLRSADFVASTGDVSSTMMRFFTKDYSSNPSERLRITSDGNVGIGTSSPGYKLDVLGDLRISGSTSTIGTFKSSASNCFISLIDSSGDNVFLGNDDGDFLIQTPTSAYSTKLIVKDDGNVGIGTTSPGAKLDVVGSAAISSTLTVTGTTALNGAVNLSTSGTPTVTLGSASSYGVLTASGSNAASIYLNGASRTGFEAKLQFGAAEHQWFNGSLSSQIMTLNTTGLGIGTSSPIAPLDVQCNTGATGIILRGRADNSTALRFYANNGTTQQLYIGTDDSNIDFVSVSTRPIRFFVNDLLQYQISQLGVFSWKDGAGGTRMTLNSTGLGIGTTSPKQSLTIFGEISLRNNDAYYWNAYYSSGFKYIGTGYAGYTIIDSTGAYTINTTNSSGTADAVASMVTRMYISSSGNVGIGTTSPTSLFTVGSTTTTTSSMTLQGEYQSSVFNNANIFNFRHGGFDRWRLLTTQNSAASNDFDFSVNAINATVNGYNTYVTVKGLTGNVGIGTTSPIQKLHIVGSTLITNNNYHYGYTVAGAQSNLIGISSADNIMVGQNNVNHANTIIYGGLGVIDLNTSGSTRMRVTYDGNVGIGTSSPSYKLDVAGGIKIGGEETLPFAIGSMYLSYNSAINRIYYGDGTGYDLRFSKRGAGATTDFVTFKDTGNVGIGTSSPASLLSVQGDINSNYNSSGTSRVWRTFATNHDSGNRGAIVLFGMYDGSPAGMNVVNAASSNPSYNSQYLTFLTHEGAVSADERMRITSLGSVGIGTTSPANLLHVAGTIRSSYFSTFYGMPETGLGLVATYGSFNQSITFASSNTNNRFRFYFDAYTSDLYVQNSTDAGSTINTRLFIKSDGNVGIGTTSPLARLHVTGSSSVPAAILMGNVGIGTTSFVYSNAARGDVEVYGSTDALISLRNATANSYIQKTGNDFYLNNGGAGFISITTNTSERMRITSDGNVGIGTSSPGEKLGILNGNIQLLATSGDPYIRLTDNGVRNWYLKVVDTSDYFEVGGTNATSLVVTGAGNVGIGTTSPNYKLDVQISSGPYNTSFYNTSTLTSSYNAILVRQASAGSATGYFGTGGSATGNPSFRNTFVVGTQSSNDFVINTTDIERMRVTAGGNVGIGTTTPFGTAVNRTVLSVNGTSDVSLNIGSNGVQRAYLYGVSTYAELGTIGSLPLTFAPNNTEKMRIASDGNVGIGTTTVSYKLDVNAAAASYALRLLGSSVDGPVIRFESTAGSGRTYHVGSTAPPSGAGTGFSIYDVTANSSRMLIDANGNVGLGTTSPDAKLIVKSSSPGPYGTGTPDFAIAGNGGGNLTSLQIYRGANTGSYIGIDAFRSGISGTPLVLNAANAGSVIIGNTTVGGYGGQAPIFATWSTGITNTDSDGGSVVIYSTSGYAQNMGSALSFGCKYNSGGSYATLARIRGAKENSTSGDYSGYFAIDTRTTGGNFSEKVRVQNDGNVGIGITVPAATLHVNGSTTIVGDTATTQNVRQTIIGTTTGNASTTAKKIFVCGHTSTGTITVTAFITSIPTASATATFSFANAYGNTVTPNRLSYVSLNSTITSIDCSYNNSGYQMEIAVTYTGATAPTLYFTAEGMGSSIWTL